MKMSKTVMAALALDAQAQALAMAVPYAALARRLATAITAATAQSAVAKEEKVTVWGTFKEAIKAAQDVGHSVTALRAGLEVACTEAGIPSGSFRGYITTVGNLYSDVLDELLTVEEVQAMSIADARKLYKVEKELSNLDKLRKALIDGTADWNEAELATLVSIVADSNAERVPAVEEVETEQEAIAI